MQGGARRALRTFCAFGLFGIHSEFAIGCEEGGVVIVRVGAVGYFVVFFEENRNFGVFDLVGEGGEVETHSVGCSIGG